MPDPGLRTAADWLLAEYDATDNPFRNPRPRRGQSPVLWRGVFVQPMFTFRSPVKSGQQMRVTKADYADTGRWWL
jgi:hypothetical protein